MTRTFMALLHRILKRLAVVWLIGIGGIMSIVVLVNFSVVQWQKVDWGAIGLILSGPPTLLAALAWVVKPPKG